MLLLAREQKVDPASLLGSYAGAMGLGQFMPSSYRRYAIDFDQDGQIDIWNNPIDAIGSVANYLHTHGWLDRQAVVMRIDDLGALTSDSFNVSLKPSMTIAEVRLAGLPVSAGPGPWSPTPASAGRCCSGHHEGSPPGQPAAGRARARGPRLRG